MDYARETLTTNNRTFRTLNRKPYKPVKSASQAMISTCSSGLLERVMAGGRTLSVTSALCCGWRCSKVVQKVKLRAAMSRSVSLTRGATSSTAALTVPG